MQGASRWIHGPLTDAALAWMWVPIFFAVRLAEGHGDSVAILMGIAFVISFAHQPLTMGLVYGDSFQFERHKRLYLWTPVVLAALVTIGMTLSLTAVAIVAALWNAEHTLMQRYGLTRIYGRKAGDDLGGLEKPMYIAWLVFALLWLPAFVDVTKMSSTLGFGDRNRKGLETLDRLHDPAVGLLIVAGIVAAGLTARWLLAQRRLTAAQRTPAKYMYVAATFGLVIAVVVDPAAGFVSYIAAHALEYFVIVHASLRRRAATGDTSFVARVAATRARRLRLYVGYTVVVLAVAYLSFGKFDGRLYAWIVLFFGGLHVFYDGFIWKLRRPSTAASLGIAVPGPAPSVPSPATA